MTFTVYDKVDLAEEGVRTEEPDARPLYEAKIEIASIDDEIVKIINELQDYHTNGYILDSEEILDLSKRLRELSERLY